MFHDGLKRRVCQTSFNVVDLLVDISLSLSLIFDNVSIFTLLFRNIMKSFGRTNKKQKNKSTTAEKFGPIFFLHFLEGIEKLISKRCQLLSFTMKGLFLL